MRNAISLIFLVLFAASCAADVPPGVLLVIESDRLVPDHLDEVEVTVTASRTSAVNICHPITRRLLPHETPDFPVYVSFDRGEIYNEWVAFQVVARLTRLDSDPANQVVFRQEHIRAWPSSTRETHTVTIDGRCYRQECGEEEYCYEGECVDSHEPGIFDPEDPRVDADVSCYRETEGE